MGFEVFIYFCDKTRTNGVRRDSVRSLFPVIEDKSEPDYWLVQYDDRNSCNIGVTPHESDSQMIVGLFVIRPCADIRLWQGMLKVLQLGDITLFWPGGPPIIANEATATRLPDGMAEDIGEPRTVHSAEEILSLLRAT